MISAITTDVGDSYEVSTRIKGNGEELVTEVLAILMNIWKEEHGAMMIDLILEQFVDWCEKQNKEDK